MDRRKILTTGFLTTIATLSPNLTKAAGFCQPTANPNFGFCRTGLDSNVVLQIAQVQLNSQWCWAACIQMIFAYHGHPMSQAAIVQATWGGVVNMPATDYQIMADLNRKWIDDNGVKFNTQSQQVYGGGASQELANGHPLIVCTLGHAMVLTSLAFYVNNVTSQGQDSEAVVRDPWKNNGRKILTAAEWNNRNLLLAVKCT